MRVPSGVPGFDPLIEGGFPKGASFIVQGPAGPEKSTLVLQFVAEGLRAGGACLVVLATASPATFQHYLRAFGVNVDRATAENRLKILEWNAYVESVRTARGDEPIKASVDLANVGMAISIAVASMPRSAELRAAIEVLSPALTSYGLPNTLGFAQSTSAKLEHAGFTSLFVLEREHHDPRTIAAIREPFDGVLDLVRAPEGENLVCAIDLSAVKGHPARSTSVELEFGPDHRLHVLPPPEAGSGPGSSPSPDDPAVAEGKKDPDALFVRAAAQADAGDLASAFATLDTLTAVDGAYPGLGMLRARLQAAQAEPATGEKESPTASQAKFCPSCGSSVTGDACATCGLVFAGRTGPPVPAPTPPRQSKPDRPPQRPPPKRPEDLRPAAPGAPPPTKPTPSPATPSAKPPGYQPSPRLAPAIRRLSENPRDPDALFVKACAQALAGDPAGAVATLERLAAVEDAYPGLWILKAKLHVQRGEPEKAVASEARGREVEARQNLSTLDREPEPAARPRPTPASTQPIDRTVERTLRKPMGPVVVVKRRVGSRSPDGMGRTNGLVNGTRGRTQGLVNGTRGRTNGLVNGTRGRTNGLVNGTRGRTNGLVNGTRGRTEGLVNGTRGRTNGLVNGITSAREGITNGLTNGSGLTNGLGSARLRREVATGRRKLYAIPLLMTVMIFVPLLGISDPSTATYPITIDGSAIDWSPAAIAGQGLGTGLNPNVDIRRLGVTDNVDYLAFFAEVNGTALRGGDAPPTMDTFRFFLDTDRDPATGYGAGGLGADRLVEVSGWRGAVNVSTMSEWDTNRDPWDWRGWIKGAAVSAAASEGRLEAQVHWLALLPQKASVFVTLHAQAFDGTVDVADSTLNSAGANLAIVQESVVAEALGGGNLPLLRLDLSAFGGDATVRGMTIALKGSASPSTVDFLRLVDATGILLSERTPLTRRVPFAFPDLPIRPGSPLRLFVIAASTDTGGETLGATLESAGDVVAPDAAVTVRWVPSARDVGYLGAPSPVPRIDGGHAEWTSLISDPSGDGSGPADADVDVTAFHVQSAGNASFFFAQVAGQTLAGAWVPRPNEGAPSLRRPEPDSDRDTVPDSVDPLPFDFNNDGTPDPDTMGDYDGDGLVDYGQFGGTDLVLNTTIPGTFPAPYANRDVSAYIGPYEEPFRSPDDILRIFVDVDNASMSGYAIGGIGADRMIEVSGSTGTVRAAGLFAFSGGYPGSWSWSRVSDVVIAVGFGRMEIEATENLTQNGSRLFVEVRGPLGSTDSTADSTRGTGAILSPALPWAGAFVEGTKSSSEHPHTLDISGNQKLYLKDTTHSTENDAACTYDKVASTQGSSLKSLSLSAGESACWYADLTTGTTISAGDWETLIDVDTSVPKSAFADNSSVSIGTSMTLLGALDTTFAASKDNLIVAVVQFDNTQSSARAIAAGNLELRRGASTVLAENQFQIDIGLNGAAGDGMFAVLPYRDAGAAASSSYRVYGQASATGVNAEVKIIVLSGLASADSAFTDGGSVTVTGSTTSVASVSTSFPTSSSSLPNIIIAAVQSEFAGSGEYTVSAGNLVLRRGTTSGSTVIASNQYAFGGDDPPKNDGISNVLVYADASGGTNQGYSVWGLCSANNCRMEAKILAFRGLAASGVDGGNTDNIDTSRVVLGTASTSFAAGDDLVIGAIQIDAQTATRTIVADGDDIREDSESSGSSNQFAHTIDNSAYSDGQFQTFVRKVTTTSSSPSYEGGAKGPATDSIDAELKLVAIHVNDSAADFDVHLQIWDLTNNDVDETIGSCTDVSTKGEDVRCWIQSVAQKTISSSQVVRIRLVHSSSSGQVAFDYDYSDPTGNSRATIPAAGVPEFQDIAIPFLATVVIVVTLRRSRRRRTAQGGLAQ